MTRRQQIVPVLIFIILGLTLAMLLAKTVQAHVPLKLLRDAHCMVETQHLRESEKDIALGPRVYLKYIGKWERAAGRCQIMPSTAKWLIWKFKWQGPVNLFLREHSEALAEQRLATCEISLYRRFKRAPSRSLSWCYLSGQISLWTPQYGKNGRYLDEIERKLAWVKRNQRNWMAWKVPSNRRAG